MASDDEKLDIINLVGKFEEIEWPWNKLELAIARGNAIALANSLGNESSDFRASMLMMRELIINELVMIHGSSGHYDEQDGGQLSAILLTVDNFTLDPSFVTAAAFQNLVTNLDAEVYVPGYNTKEDLDSNIFNDIWFIMSSFEEWCLVSGHQDWIV